MRRIPVSHLWTEPPSAVLRGVPAHLEAAVLFERDSPPAGPAVRLALVGDVGLSGSVRRAIADGAEPLAELAPVLAAADLALANLETPVVPGEPAAPGFFAAGPEAAQHLARAGVRLVHLANNHVLDFGPAGLATTLEAVAAAGLAPLGAGADERAARTPVVLETRVDGGPRIAWLGCGRTLEPQEDGGPRFWELDADELADAVRRARREADLVVVSIHAGYMYLDLPHPDHRQLAHRLAEAGASVVAMHHPHVLQGIEVGPGSGLLCYSLGNLLFDWTEGEVVPDLMIEEQRQGVVLLVDLDRQGVVRAAALPTRVDDAWTVRWADGAAGTAVLDRLARTSELLGLPEAERAATFDRQRSRRTTGLALGMIGRRLARGDLLWALRILPRVRPAHLRMLVRWAGERLVPGRRQRS